MSAFIDKHGQNIIDIDNQLIFPKTFTSKKKLDQENKNYPFNSENRYLCIHIEAKHN